MSFHSRLRPIQGRPGIHSALAITSSIVSPWMSGEQVERVLEAFEPDWERIFALAAGALLSPVLWERINEKNLTARIPKDFLMALQVIHEANCERNRQHKMVLLDAVRELNRLGIEPVLLKGAHALAGLEPDQDARILSDIDLIIPDGRAREAQNHLISMGYYDQPLHEGKWHPEEYDGHQMEPLFHPTLPAYLELHHYPHWKEYSENLVNYILSDLQPMELEGCHMKVMPLEARLIYNQFHHFYSDMDRNAEVDLRFLVEQAAFMQCMKPGSVQAMKQRVVEDYPEFAEGMNSQFELVEVLFGEFDGLAVTSAAGTELYLRYLLGNEDHEKYRKRQVLKSMASHLFWLIRNPGSLAKRLLSPGWYAKLPKTLSEYYRSGRILKPGYRK